jgi:endonuclease-8
MPEGDTVWLAAQRMDHALAGQVLTLTDFRVPALATADLRGQTVLAVVPRGKHLLTRMSGGLTLHTHFRMDGTWHLYAPDDRWAGGPDFQVRVVLATASTVAVGYRLPVVELVPTSAEAQVVGHLGPDVLDDAFDAAEAVRRLQQDPAREIGMALLDQRNLAGIGNLYRTEVLFLQGITPWTPVRDVDLDRVVARSVRLMRANRARWEQSTTGNLRPGMDHWVFERAGKPCRRCGQRVLRAEQGEAPRARVTYWCGHCQVGPQPT